MLRALEAMGGKASPVESYASVKQSAIPETEANEKAPKTVAEQKRITPNPAN